MPGENRPSMETTAETLAQAFFRPGRARILPPCAGNKALASIDPDPDHCQINQQPEI